MATPAIRFQTYPDAGRWRWRALARNGKIVGESPVDQPGYKSERNAERACEAFVTSITAGG